MDSLEMTKASPASSASPPVGAPNTPLASCCSTATSPPDAARSWLSNRRMLAIGGIALGGAGLALGWDWLTALGIAPLLISVAPCLIMCALGLCMMGRGQPAISGRTAPDAGAPTAPTDPPVSR